MLRSKVNSPGNVISPEKEKATVEKICRKVRF